MSDGRMRTSIPIGMWLLIVGVACLSAWPRFGQRENPESVLSDSDFYLDMALVFNGEKAAFTPELVELGRHHYSRPALPFLAAKLGKHGVGGNYPAAFSMVNIAAAVLLAVCVYSSVRNALPQARFAWTVPFLTLTGFPQINWGYHLLTDTFGLATTLATSLLAVHVLDAFERNPLHRRVWWLVSVSGLAALAFLSRETGWFAPVAVGLYGVFRLSRGEVRFLSLALVLGALVAGKAPSWAYAAHFGVHGIDTFSLSPSRVLSPWYVLDFVVKSAVAFHVAWLPVLYVAVRREWRLVSPFIVAWTIAAILYMGAGYLHNDPNDIGYPLRLVYALLPLVYLCSVRFFGEVRFFANHPRRVAAACVAYAAIGLIGTALDQGGRITVQDLLSRIV